MAEAPEFAEAAVWRGVDRLIERSPSLDDLRVHRLHLLAARRWREEGRAIPRGLALEELAAMKRRLVADRLLRRVAQIIGQESIVLKGPAAAAMYPDPWLRPAGDLDLLLEDAPAAQGRLLQAGFVFADDRPLSYWQGHRHERPLLWPGDEGGVVELHSSAPWCSWAAAPVFSDLRGAAAPGPSPGVLLPDPAFHAVVLACHSWDAIPLRRASDFVDVALALARGRRGAAATLAEEWNVSSVWEITVRVVESLILGAAPPLPLRTWARDLLEVRERTVLEHHLRQWVAPFLVHPPVVAARQSMQAIRADLSPVGGEPLTEKIRRVALGVRRPLQSKAGHDATLGESARRLRPLRPGPGRD